jgi:hypothetical protein
MSATLENILSLGEIEIDGVRLKVRPEVQLEQKMFATWLKKRSREQAAMAIDLPADVQDRMVKEALRDGTSGYYDWGGDGYFNALSTAIGLAKMLSIVCSAENPATPVDEDQVMLWYQSESFKQVAVMLAMVMKDDDKKKAILRSVGLPENYLDSSETPSPESPISHPT